MCLSLKQMEWADIYRRVIKNDKEEVQEKLQKFPSRERNHAVRRKLNNNNFRSHANCVTCAKIAEDDR
ncbi:jg10565 [Pararge aegeria aegeria]|uniref:Jg10565 protein n=2 Tax=Pararge aegeria TaxID=116150 RepID=A0A8S4R8U8_9NEOP|nr:jg10565 [Pararge aegeria aegeria]